jgi:uncharacterized membrane protein
MKSAKHQQQAPDHVDHRLERLMFFSDAVFAIAITLLVIEIKVPHLHSGNLSEAWESLATLLPNFGGYILSFLVIGRFWMAHHATLQMPENHIPALMWPNLLLLMTVAFMPFATANMADNLLNRGPMIFYNYVLLAVSLANTWVVFIATKPEYVRSSITNYDRVAIRGRSLGVVVTVLVTLCASYFITGGLSQVLLALMFVFQRLAIWMITLLTATSKSETVQ